MIVLKDVSKRYGKSSVLSGVSFEVLPGEFLCITGPSGAGKSTLIHILTGAESVSDGSVEVDGVDLRRVPFPVMQIYRRRIGIVFQDYKLLRTRTVRENVAFPLEVCGVPAGEIGGRVEGILQQMGILHRADALPPALSGGEKARAAIARAMVHQPMILLADEPTGNVDPVQSEKIMQLFRDINAAGTTVVLATHDTALVDRLQKRVIRIENGAIVRDSHGGYASRETTTPHQVFAGTPKGSSEETATVMVTEDDDDD